MDERIVIERDGVKFSFRPTLRVFNTKEAANYIGLGIRTLAQWRSEGKGPTYVKMENAVVYRIEDLERYMEQGARRAS